MKRASINTHVLLTIMVFLFCCPLKAQNRDTIVYIYVNQPPMEETNVTNKDPRLAYPKVTANPSRKIQRIERSELGNVFIPKGEWLFGGTVGYNGNEGDNINFLVAKNINISGYSFSVAPYIGYFVANNFAIGARFNYNRSLFDLGNLDLNLGEDFNISLSDLYYLNQKYEANVFGRLYTPLGKSKVYGLFSEMRLTYSHSVGKNSTGSGTEYDGTYNITNGVGINFTPGICVFMSNFAAVEASVGVMGVNYYWSRQTTNQVETGYFNRGGANFRINLMSVNLGMTFFL